MRPPLILTPPEPRPRRRCLWAEELRRTVAYFSERLARDRAAAERTAAELARRIADLQGRITDLERAAGLSDLHRPEPRRSWRQ